MKFHMTQSSHSKQKLRVLFDLMVGKHHSILLEEEKRSDTSRSRPENTTERKREPQLLVYRIIRDNVYYTTTSNSIVAFTLDTNGNGVIDPSSNEQIAYQFNSAAK